MPHLMNTSEFVEGRSIILEIEKEVPDFVFYIAGSRVSEGS
jgi:hypothetical protein